MVAALAPWADVQAGRCVGAIRLGALLYLQVSLSSLNTNSIQY